MRLNRGLLLPLTTWLASALLAAQPRGQSVKLLQFEAASAKPAPERTGEARFVRISDTPGRLSYQNVTVKVLISIAWEMDSDHVREQNEKWLDSEPWDIAAVFPANTSKPQVHEMLRNLLTETFGLVQHSTYKATGAMELIADPRGQKLKEAAPGADGTINIFRGRILARGITTKTLAAIVTRQVGRGVIDKTESPGLFEIDLKWSPDTADPNTTDQDLSGSIQGALRDQLGLRLRPSPEKARIEYLVIDKAIHPPAGQ